MTGGTVAACAVVGVIAVGAAVGMSGGGGSTIVASAPTAQQQAGAPAAGGDCVIPAGKGGTAGLNPTQAATARAIIAAASKAGVGEAGARIGVATAMVEADLLNPNSGHSSSIGAFQELAGGGSGFQVTDQQRLDVAGAAGRFFTKLKRVNGWASLDPGVAAQKVQRSAFPARYGQKMSAASAVVAALGGGSTGCVTAAAPAAASKQVAPVLAWAASKDGSPYIFGGSGPVGWDCSSFTQKAWSLAGVKMPRTAEAQRQWCASGKCASVPLGSEQPGDLIFWNSYLGTGVAGHVVMVYDPKQKRTIEARSTKDGIGFFSYAKQASGGKSMFQIYRPRAS